MYIFIAGNDVAECTWRRTTIAIVYSLKSWYIKNFHIPAFSNTFKAWWIDFLNCTKYMAATLTPVKVASA